MITSGINWSQKRSFSGEIADWKVSIHGDDFVHFKIYKNLFCEWKNAIWQFVSLYE